MARARLCNHSLLPMPIFSDVEIFVVGIIRSGGPSSPCTVLMLYYMMSLYANLDSFPLLLVFVAPCAMKYYVA
jgi:hypothetical protein